MQKYLRSRELTAGDSEDFARRVHSHTDGLPLFVANLVDALLTSEQPTPKKTTILPIPADLMGAVERRIGPLPKEVVGLLEGAAVCGLGFSARVLASVLNRKGLGRRRAGMHSSSCACS